MRSYIEISKEALLHNLGAVRRHVPKEAVVMCVVKGNAYGHGLREVVGILDGTAEYFGVDSVSELEILREVSDTPVLVMGYVPEDELKRALELDAEIVVYDIGYLQKLDEVAGKRKAKARVHIKVDAGLGRQGVLVPELGEFLKGVEEFEHIEIIGAYGHFANLEDTENTYYADKQLELFARARKIFERHDLGEIKFHMSATAGALLLETRPDRSIGGRQHDFVRLGLGLYGMWPSEHTKQIVPGIELVPALRWVSRVAQVKTLPPGFSIGYGCTFTTQRETRVAIVPQGYADGYDRGLSNKGEVLIGGRRYPVLGRVMMNMIVVDVSHVAEVKRESEVVLLGSQGDETISAEELADKLGTINYEITTRISPLLPRVVV